jgi:hypothetical protein
LITFLFICYTLRIEIYPSSNNNICDGRDVMFSLVYFLSNRHIIDERQYKYNLIESAETR